MGNSKQTQEKTTDATFPITRVEAPPHTGLTDEQVKKRMDCGARNISTGASANSTWKIISKNVFTLFNLINIVLALAILWVGNIRNTMFLLVAVLNTAMGIYQELRAKRTLDRLSILARGQVPVVRNGETVHIPPEDVVLDDILYLNAGRQVCADTEAIEVEGLEMDESLLTGESDHIIKQPGDTVMSGSFVVSGKAWARVNAVGAQSFAGKLTQQAKKQKKANTPLMRTINNIIRILTIAIIPVGGLLFYYQYEVAKDLKASILGASAAILGMIPEGLILLTGVTLMVGAMKLAGRKALVQSLPSIETLARVDVLCLDKTGTITNGSMNLELVLPFDGLAEEELRADIRETVAAIGDDNATAQALTESLGAAEGWKIAATVPFSSARKWSAAVFEQQGSFVLGAPGFVFPGDTALVAKAQEYAVQGLRVLCIAHSRDNVSESNLPADLRCLGLIVLSDTIRPEAPDTFRYFEKEGVTLKVISGDDAQTVATIAKRAGITGAEKCIDLSTVPADADFVELANTYVVFGRVTPEQKKKLVEGLKLSGKTVCMTGDGVNDVLAMKESDCGVAMISGSEAARSAADFVLMTGDFSSMVQVLQEGRRVINNIECVASLYLVKTIYSTILSVVFIYLPAPYPFSPLQMMPISFLAVGVPSFFLALRENYQKPRGLFGANIMENALPAALVVVADILLIELTGYVFELEQIEISSMGILVTGAVGFFLLQRVARPLKAQEFTMVALVMGLFVLCFVWLNSFFELDNLLSRNAFFYIPLICAVPWMLDRGAKLVAQLHERWIHWRQGGGTILGF